MNAPPRVFVAGWCRHDGQSFIYATPPGDVAAGREQDRGVYCSKTCKRTAQTLRRLGVTSASKCLGCSRMVPSNPDGTPRPLCRVCYSTIGRMCLGKRQHPDYPTAKDVAARHSVKVGVQLAPYGCDLCEHWHIGGPPRKPEKLLRNAQVCERVREALQPGAVDDLRASWVPWPRDVDSSSVLTEEVAA